jgi:hypothetical protein
MTIEFLKRGKVRINNAKIRKLNFAGRPTDFNPRGGDRSFLLVFDDMELVEALQNDENRYGVSWNVRIKEPRNADENPYMFLPVKVKYNGDPDKDPIVYVESGRNKRILGEHTVASVDTMDIVEASVVISPNDREGQYGPYRTAYLHSMYVVQEVDEFAARFAEEEFPEE